MVWELGLEPRTLGLENRCSIQLSYTHIIELRKLAIELELARHSTEHLRCFRLCSADRGCRPKGLGSIQLPASLYELRRTQELHPHHRNA